jgi:GTPase SAR1 family protein
MGDAAEAKKAPPEFKIVFVGDSSVGKTSLILWYCNRTFADDRVCVPFAGRQDAARARGQERYRSLVPMYSRGAVVAVIAFDVSSRETFDDVEMWIAEVRNNVSQTCRIVIAGNKCDRQYDRLSRDEIERWERGSRCPSCSSPRKRGRTSTSCSGP